jgi:hypothetical protein
MRRARGAAPLTDAVASISMAPGMLARYLADVGHQINKIAWNNAMSCEIENDPPDSVNI